MAGIPVTLVTQSETAKLLALEENHFAELKGIDVTPGKVSKALSAFANAEGGDVFIGIEEEPGGRTRRWRGFQRIEDANGMLQVFEELFPLGEECTYGFLQSAEGPGYVLKAEIRKSRGCQGCLGRKGLSQEGGPKPAHH